MALTACGVEVFDLTSYLPDSFIPQYEEIRDTLLSWLKKFGFIHREDGAVGMVILCCNVDNLAEAWFSSLSVDSTRARQAYTDALSTLERLKTEKDKAEGDVKEIFDIHGFGAEGEWKKLDGQCMRTDSGECVSMSHFLPHIIAWVYIEASFFHDSYTYELCFFGEAKQIPKLGGSTFSLGSASTCYIHDFSASNHCCA